MANLGFARNFNQIPGIPRVRFRPEGDDESTLLSARTRRRGRQEWELSLPAFRGPAGAGQAGSRAAEVMEGLSWPGWALDASSLAEICGLSLAEALVAWGEAFWPRYGVEAVVFLVAPPSVPASRAGGTSQPRLTLNECALAWQARFGHVRVDRANDVEAIEEERRLVREARLRRLSFGLLYPLPRTPRSMDGETREL